MGRGIAAALVVGVSACAARDGFSGGCGTGIDRGMGVIRDGRDPRKLEAELKVGKSGCGCWRERVEERAVGVIAQGDGWHQS